VEKGRKEGRKEGTRLILQKQINKRFGVVPRDIEERINALEQPQLEELAEKILENKHGRRTATGNCGQGPGCW